MDKKNPNRLPTRERLNSLYETDKWEFVSNNLTGYVIDVDHVAGFVPHRLHRAQNVDMSVPLNSNWTSANAPQMIWAISSLQLVSLLKHEKPYVYDSKTLPDMQALPDAELRELDEFEQASLKSLHNGEDLCVQGRENQVRMLGSLRASKRCLRCHSVERGALLGAFTYEFVRESAWMPEDDTREGPKD